MHRNSSVTALVREFVKDQSSEPRQPHRPRIGSLGVLEPDQAIAACQGAVYAWAVTNLPGSRLGIVQGHLVVAR